MTKTKKTPPLIDTNVITTRSGRTVRLSPKMKAHVSTKKPVEKNADTSVHEQYEPLTILEWLAFHREERNQEKYFPVPADAIDKDAFHLNAPPLDNPKVKVEFVK